MKTRMTLCDLKRAHQNDLQLLSVVYFYRGEVARKRMELASMEEQLIEAEANYERAHAAVEAEAVPYVVELKSVKPG